MGFFDSVRSWFANEAAEVKESATSFKASLESEMDKREADLQATPEQRLETIQNEISDDPFAEVRNRIEGKQAQAEARDEVAASERPDINDSEAAKALNDLANEVGDGTQT
ncbi:MAG: hypothetical protein HKN03_14465 [Acidimicrobiales bacterium]|nr:hypothetical protein [Acidimicrobiales bacterium]